MITEILFGVGVTLAALVILSYLLYAFLMPFKVSGIRRDLQHIEELLEVLVERMTE